MFTKKKLILANYQIFNQGEQTKFFFFDTFEIEMIGFGWLFGNDFLHDKCSRRKEEGK